MGQKKTNVRWRRIGRKSTCREPQQSGDTGERLDSLKDALQQCLARQHLSQYLQGIAASSRLAVGRTINDGCFSPRKGAYEMARASEMPLRQLRI